MSIEKVQEFIKKENLFTFDDKLIVGVSGGMDSVVLICILKKLGYSCIVAHCNFHLRREESDRDADFVHSLAEKLNLPFVKTDFDTEKYASERKISIEMAARELRYDWFHKIKKEEKADFIAIAHHADDIIETFLINLTRGTGIHGLTGIKPKNGDIVRPLLCLSRNEISDFLREENLLFVEDSTNQENIYIRNQFRNCIIPQFKSINPSFNKTLFQTIHNLQEAENFINGQLEGIKRKIIQKKDIQTVILLEPLKEDPSGPFILFEILKPYGFSPAAISDIWKGLNSISGKQYLSDKYRIIKDRNKLLLSDILENDENEEYKIYKTDNKTEVPFHIAISVVENSPGFIISKNKKIVYLDFDKLSFPLIIRKWRKGDRFIPFGMKKHKKISDYFIDQHFSLLDKENAWILTSNEKIVWIIGERSDEYFKITEKTKKIMILEVNK
jgi:tRNA(Ile)-lysidine synthase